MLSYNTKNRLADVLLAMGDGERQIEIVRQILCEQVDFEPYAAFKRIDRLQKGTIDSVDIVNFLADNKVYYTENNCRAFIKRYDLDGDGQLVYNEFLYAVLPMDNPTLRTVATQRPNYDVAEDQLLSYDVEYSLAKVIDREISFYLNLDYQKTLLHNCYDFTYSNAFNTIDRFFTGLIDFTNLDEFFRRQGIFPNEDELVAILRRFDKNDDGRLTPQEFAIGLEPIDSRITISLEKPKSTVAYTSPIRSRVYSPARKVASTVNKFDATSPIMRNAAILNRTASPLRATSPLRTTLSPARRIASPSRDVASPVRRVASPSRFVASPSRRVASPLRSHVRRQSASTRKVASPTRTYSRSPVRTAFQDSITRFSGSVQDRAASPVKFSDKESQFRSTGSTVAASSYGFRAQASPLRKSRVSSPLSKSPSRQGPLRRSNLEDDTYDRKVQKTFEKSTGILKKSGTYSKSAKSPTRTTKGLSAKKETRRGKDFQESTAKEALIDALKQFIHFEKELEISKQDLSLRPDFNLLDFFRTFDVEGRGSISSSELSEGMKRYGAYPNKEELYLFLRRFDRDNDGKLKFSDFTEAFICKQQEYANLLNNRTPINADLSLEIDQIFTDETKKAITKILRMHLENEGSIESLRQKLSRTYNFNVHEAFSYLDVAEDGVINIDELSETLDKNDFYATQKELKLLMDRLDANRDGKITYSEFVQEMTPKSEKAF